MECEELKLRLVEMLSGVEREMDGEETHLLRWYHVCSERVSEALRLGDRTTAALYGREEIETYRTLKRLTIAKYVVREILGSMAGMAGPLGYDARVALEALSMIYQDLRSLPYIQEKIDEARNEARKILSCLRERGQRLDEVWEMRVIPDALRILESAREKALRRDLYTLDPPVAEVEGVIRVWRPP